MRLLLVVSMCFVISSAVWIFAFQSHEPTEKEAELVAIEIVVQQYSLNPEELSASAAPETYGWSVLVTIEPQTPDAFFLVRLNSELTRIEIVGDG